MTETLKEARPSDEAWSKAKETYTRTGSWSESVRSVYGTDVAPLIAERDALKARVVEVEKVNAIIGDAFEPHIKVLENRVAELQSSLAASRRQVEGLREDLERIHSAADEGSYRGCPHCLQVMGMIDEALSALDALQPDPRDAIIAEAVELLRPVADIVNRISFNAPDEACVIVTTIDGGIIDTSRQISLRDLRAARAFVEKHGGNQ